MALEFRLFPTMGALQEAHDEWLKQLNHALEIGDSEIEDVGIEVITYINQAIAKLERVEEVLDNRFQDV